MKKQLLFLMTFLSLSGIIYGQYSFSTRVNASTDDAEEEVTSGAMYTNSSDLELVYDDFVNDDQYVAMRFTSVNIPANAIILNAYIQFEVDELKKNDPCNLFIFAEDTVTALTYSTTSFDISGRTYINDSVAWNPGTWEAVDDQSFSQRTSNIGSLIQQLVNKPTWTTTNDVAFMIKGSGTRTAESFDGEANNAPKLVINYTLPNTFMLQLLHASDLEGGVEAIEDAPNFAAIVDKLEDYYPNTVTISSGDNYIPGPFFNAASEDPIEDSLRSILSDFYGTSLNSLGTARGRIDISIMNVIGFDASALGNHEFDVGVSALSDIILSSGGGSNLAWMGAQFPYLSANLDFSSSTLNPRYVGTTNPNTDFITDVNNPATASSTPKVAPATIIDRGGEKIGVVGATTQLLETISSPSPVSVKGSPTTNDMAQLAVILQPYIDDMINNKSVNKVIVTTHLQQFSLEQQLAGLLSGVDIIIAGGSDFLLADGNDELRAGDVAAGTYPFETLNKDGDPLLIVSTDGQYSYVGRLVVGFDAAGILLTTTLDSVESGAYATTSSLTQQLFGSEDPHAPGSKGWYTERLTNSIKDIVISKDGNTFGKTNHFLEGRRTFVRTEETNVGDLTADANLWMAKKYDSEVAVSLKNGGGIRAEIGIIDQMNAQLLPPQPNPVAGKDSLEVSQLDIENTLRFNNGLKVIETTPVGLKTLLEHGISNWNGVSTEGRMPQIGGMRFSFDSSKAAGSRIINMAIINENDSVIDSVVVNGVVYGDTTRIIKMVSLNFMVDNDGDGYPFSTTTTNGVDLDNSNITHTQQVMFADLGSEQNAMAEYLLEFHSTQPFDMKETSPSEDNRIQILAFRGDSVFVETKLPDGIEYNKGFGENKINAFPNPSETGLFYLNFNNGKLNGTAVIYNIVGKKVFEKTFAGEEKGLIDMSSSDNGIYFGIYNSNGENKRFKLVIRK